MGRMLTSVPVVPAPTVIVATLLMLMSSPTVLPAQSVNGNNPAYLALGDSFPFGSMCQLLPCVAAEGVSAFETAKNDNWFVGYPDYLQVLIDRPLINPSCPGQNTTNFMSGADGPVCGTFKNGGKLHVDYKGISQMAWAVGYLTTHDRVQLITLHLGGPETNTLIRGPAPRGCAYDYQNPTLEAEACIAERFPAHQAGVIMRLGIILETIRGTGYSGRIIVPSYGWYTFNDYVAQIAPAFYQAWRPTLEAYGAELAPVFERFQEASRPYGGSPCAAGVQIQNADGSCNIHPAPQGHQLIADIIFEMLLSPPQ